MNKYYIRYNKNAGMSRRGSNDHVWRVFENGKEYIFKHFQLNVPCRGEQFQNEWNVACEGYMTIDRINSIAIINGENND